MRSDKVNSLLYKYEIDVPDGLTEAQAWSLISQKSRKARKPKPAVSVCFSGLTASMKDELASAAKAVDFKVNSSVAKSTTHLCCDLDRVGPAKLQKAHDQNVAIVTVKEFRHMLETGEIL